MSKSIHVDTIILGSSGLTGSHLLSYLIEDPEVSAILEIGRNPTFTISPKVIHESLSILQGSDTSQMKYTADICFLCLGTTRKKAGSKANFEKIDRDLMVEAARFALNAGVKKIVLISAVGASSSSMIHYSRIKGQTESLIKAMPFDEYYIFRPSLLLGNRTEKRTAEKLSIKIYQMVEPFVAQWLGKYRPVPAWQLAKAMIACTRIKSEPNSKLRIYYYKDIKRLLSL